MRQVYPAGSNGAQAFVSCPVGCIIRSGIGALWDFSEFAGKIRGPFSLPRAWPACTCAGATGGKTSREDFPRNLWLEWRSGEFDTVEQTKESLLNRLVAVVQELPEDKVLEVYDFADYLQRKYRPRDLERGSAEAILQALERVGPLQFEPGELDDLLTDIERMRAMDLDEHG